MSWLSHALFVRHRTMRSIFVGIIAFSLGAAGAAAAVRGFVSSDNLFHACANSVGNVRVLADGDACKNGEVGFMFPSQAYVDAVSTAFAQGDADTLAAAKSYTDTSVASEAAARRQGDADETAARQAADTALQAADAALQANVDSETAARTAGDAAESAARQAADTTLQTNLDNEMAARRQGDADTLAAAKAYTDAHAGGALALQILSTRVSNPAQLDPGGTLTASVSCTGGKVVIGGGASSSNREVLLFQSFPSSTLQWTASARAVGTVAPFGAGLTVFVICAGT